MKISIVTISYNQGQFLERCICSVIEQDYDDIEYIVVDPGSTDGSREIIEKYRGKISKVIFEPDNGPADGLNKGFSVVTGDIFGYLNSDDLFLPGALSEVALFFTKNPCVDVMSGHSIVIDEKGNTRRKIFSDEFSAIRYVYRASFISQSSTFFSAATFKNSGGFNANNRVAWDADLWAKMAMNGARFSVLDKMLSCSRIYGGTISSSTHRGEEGDEYREKMFLKVMGRDRNALDSLIQMMFRILRLCKNPKALYERLRHGPIYSPPSKMGNL